MNPTYEEIEAKIALLEVQLKLSEAAERAWESSMMQACGEDGPKSVADKFAELESKLGTALRECRSAGITIDNLEAKCAALAAENAGLKAAFDKPQAYLSWHAIPPTWGDPLPCGEYFDVHDEVGHKNSDGTDCWPVFAKPEIETPATYAFLAEVRAQGVEMAMEHMQSSGSLTFGDCYISLNEFAAQLRKGGNQ